MDNLRDKIADMLTDADTSYAKSGDAPSANELADAILALPEISDLQEKLAEAEANINLKADWIEATINDMSANEEAAQAAISRAYQMGVDAAAAITDTKKQQARLKGGGPNRSVYKDKGSATAIDLRKTLAANIRAMQPPADLVDRVAISQEWDRVMEGGE